MRILHVIDSQGVYGAETVLLNLASEQLARGDRPAVLSIGSTGAPEKAIEVEARRRGIECLPLRMRDGLNLAGGAEILAVAGRQGADVIHSHGYKGNILLGLQPRRSRREPVITTLHGWTARSTFSKLGLYRALDQLVLSRLDAVVVVNERMLRLRPVAKLGDSATFIANGIAMATPSPGDPRLRDAIARLRERCGPLLGVVGRLSPEKNVTGLVAALAQLPAEHSRAGLVVLGAGPELAALESAIDGAGLRERVLLGGYVPDARDYLPHLDALVIPSLTEGLPMILLEAMAARLPVVSTRVGDIPSALAGLGELVEPGDPRALAQGIAAVLADLPARRVLAAQAADRIANHYSAAAMAGRYAEVYNKVAQRAREE
jgi:glycosyltransferase involved in cell wall biosynthesis